MKLPGAASSYLLSVDTLLFRSEGLRVAAVNDQNRVELKPITIGHDYGNEVEVTSGLTGKELIIMNPPDAIVQGQEVRLASTQSTNPPQGAGAQ